MKRTTAYILALVLSSLLVLTSVVGLTVEGFYSLETPNWQAQSSAQDMVNLFIVMPVLLVSSILTYRKNKYAPAFQSGTLLYLVYTFTLYCFDVHFNRLFFAYCLTLGISFYLFLFSVLPSRSVENMHQRNSVSRLTGIYFITIGILFYFLWLSEIIPASISGIIPPTVLEAGLFTNGVHVLDLSVILPGIVITGTLIIRGQPRALLLAPVILVFFILMDLTIAIIILFMRRLNLGGSLAVVAAMATLAVFSVILLVQFLRKHPVED